MLKHIPILVILLILNNSCATLLTRKTYNLKVTSDAQAARIQIRDSIYNLPAKFRIKRSKADLPIKLIVDTLTKDFIVKSSLNPAFIFGNLLWVEFSPAAYLIDLTNQKRFYYGRSISLSTYDTNTIIEPIILKNIRNYFSKEYPVHKEQIFLKVSLPWINSFYLQPSLETAQSNTGFWGFSVGLDYYYTDTRFFNLSFYAVSDFFVPVPAAVDISGEYDIMSSLYTSFTHNHKLGRFYLGYGISVGNDTWAHRYSSRFGALPPSKDPISKISLSAGLMTDAYYQFGEHFFAGIVYRPSFMTGDQKTEFKYEHIISLELAWKIKLK
jgi:hypothetical protein